MYQVDPLKFPMGIVLRQTFCLLNNKKGIPWYKLNQPKPTILLVNDS